MLANQASEVTSSSSPAPPKAVDFWYNLFVKKNRPYFLWDYDLTEKDVRRILRGKNETEKIWMMSRILESASYNDVWRYVNLAQVREMFPKLRLKPPIYRAWERALYAWN